MDIDYHVDRNLPELFYELSALEVHKVIPRPTLFYIEGVLPESILLTVLLHGNETTGFEAIQNELRYLKILGEKPLRSIYLFIANPEAASQNQRFLPSQPDFNRIWQESELAHDKSAWELLEFMKSKDLFAAIDLHNNTGKNPPYSCTNQLTPKNLSLASHFSDTVVFFERPEETHVVAFSQFTQSLTLECGKIGDKQGLKQAQKFCHFLMMYSQIEVDLDIRNKLNIYETKVRLRIPENHSIGFACGDQSADFVFRKDLEDLNFCTIEDPEPLGLRKNGIQLDIQGRDSSSEYFFYEDDQIMLQPGVVPCMFTKDAQIMSKDCVGYLMVKI